MLSRFGFGLSPFTWKKDRKAGRRAGVVFRGHHAQAPCGSGLVRAKTANPMESKGPENKGQKTHRALIACLSTELHESTAERRFRLGVRHHYLGHDAVSLGQWLLSETAPWRGAAEGVAGHLPLERVASYKEDARERLLPIEQSVRNALLGSRTYVPTSLMIPLLPIEYVRRQVWRVVP